MEISGKIAVWALAGLIGGAFTACGSSDSDEILTSTDGIHGTVTPPSTEPGAVDPTVTGVLTSSQAGKYIEATATQLKQLCNPQDQRGAVESLMVIANVLDSYGVAGQNSDMGYSHALAKATRSMAQNTESGDYAGISRAVQQVSNSFTVNPRDYLGVYTPVYDDEEEEYVWAKTADSFNAIIFRSEKDRVEVSLTVSGESWTGKFDTVDYDYDGYWDDKNQVWVSNDTEITTHWNVNVPAKLTFVMSHNGDNAVSAVVESNYSESAHTFAVKSSAQLANISANAEVTGIDTSISEKCNASIGSSRVLYSVAEVKGTNLCNRQMLEQLGNAGPDAIASQIDNLFKGATAKVDLLDRIQISSSCSSLKAIVANGDYDEEVLQEVNAFAAALNSSVTTTLNFGNTDYEQGTITWGAMPHTSWGYTWYDVEPMVALAGGSAMSFGDFIDSGALNGSINAIKGIVNTYRGAFGLD